MYVNIFFLIYMIMNLYTFTYKTDEKLYYTTNIVWIGSGILVACKLKINILILN